METSEDDFGIEDGDYNVHEEKIMTKKHNITCVM